VCECVLCCVVGCVLCVVCVWSHRSIAEWATLRSAAKGTNVLLKHFVSLPLGIAASASIDELVFSCKKDSVALEKIAAVSTEVTSSMATQLLHNRDVTRIAVNDSVNTAMHPIDLRGDVGLDWSQMICIVCVRKLRSHGVFAPTPCTYLGFI
jgi:hypothetical protein